MTRERFILDGVRRSVELMRLHGHSEIDIRASIPMLAAAVDAWLTRQGETVH